MGCVNNHTSTAQERRRHTRNTPTEGVGDTARSLSVEETCKSALGTIIMRRVEFSKDALCERTTSLTTWRG